MSAPDELDEQLRRRVAALFDPAADSAPLDAALHAEQLARAYAGAQRQRSRARRVVASTLLMAAAAALIWLRVEPSPGTDEAVLATQQEPCRLPEAPVLSSDTARRSLALGPLGQLTADASSDLRVQSAQRCELRLRLRSGALTGDLHALRPARLVIETPNANVIVTGTRFAVRVGSELQVLLEHGAVAVELRSGRTLQLQAGSALTYAAPDTAPRVAPLTAAESEQIERALGPARGAATARTAEAAQAPQAPVGERLAQAAVEPRGEASTRPGTPRSRTTRPALHGAADAPSRPLRARARHEVSIPQEHFAQTDPGSGAATPRTEAPPQAPDFGLATQAPSSRSAATPEADSDTAAAPSHGARLPAAAAARTAQPEARPADATGERAAPAQPPAAPERTATRVWADEPPASATSSELLAAAERARRCHEPQAARALYARAAARGDENAEVALLRWARLELELDAAARAADVLARHARTIRSPRLGAEAAWLRVRVLSAQGQDAAARAAATQLLSTYPETPQARAAREWLKHR